MVIILMGAAGAGKTTVGQALAEELGWRFVDSDDYHPAENVQAMRCGRALTDRDRAGWLSRLRALVERAIDRREHTVLACSALKAQYREALRRGLRGVRFVYLKADPELLRHRLAARRGHFAGPSLLDSQLAALEEPVHALIVNAADPPSAIVGRVRQEFGL